MSQHVYHEMMCSFLISLAYVGKIKSKVVITLMALC